MNRKERLKLTRTPEKGFVYGDESLFLPTPTPKKYVEKKEEDVLPFRVVNNNSWRKTFKIDRNNSIVPEKNLEEVKKNFKKENITKKMYNIARIELGTSVMVEKDIYKHGLYGFRTHNDPNTILNDNLSPGDCLSIQKDTGLIRIDFRCGFTISRIGIFHPDTENQESAMKDFEIVEADDTILGKFTYDLTKSKYQYFDFTPTYTTSIRIRILSNNGCKKYTTLYKIFIYGNLNKKLH